MNMLIMGVVLWALVHWMPRLMPNIKTQLLGVLGNNGYRGVFSLCILSALALIVFGWKAAPIEAVYVSPPSFRHIAMLIMFFAFILFGSAKAPVRIKRYIRHPQLMSVVLWSFAHLLANGECRSVILFGGMGSWAIIQILLINWRDPQYVPPETDSWAREIKVLVISVVIMMLAMFAHRWFAGVALF